MSDFNQVNLEDMAVEYLTENPDVAEALLLLNSNMITDQYQKTIVEALGYHVEGVNNG